MIDTNTKHAILKAHIEALNAKADLGLITDPAHWDNKIYQIDTPEKFDHYMAVTTLSEAIESIDGYKPNHASLKVMSIEQLNKAIDAIYARAC